MATELFAQNKYQLDICLCDGHLEEVKAAGAHAVTTTGIFLKQEKKLDGLARKRARRERGYPSEGVKLSTGPLCLCGTGQDGDRDAGGSQAGC